MLVGMRARVPYDRRRADHEQPAQVAVALLGDRAQPLFASVEFCLGTSPIQAANSRPDLKTPASGTVAAIAVAPITPMPGMVSRRRLASLERCCSMNVALDLADLLAKGSQAGQE